jgi:hypothetical protein
MTIILDIALFLGFFQAKCLRNLIIFHLDQWQRLSLTFSVWMGKCFPSNYTSFLSGKENTIPQWAFKFHSALSAAETWNLKVCVLVVNKGPHWVGAAVSDDGNTFCVWNVVLGKHKIMMGNIQNDIAL